MPDAPRQKIVGMVSAELPGMIVQNEVGMTFRHLLFCLLLSIPGIVHAKWYESTGSAPILNGEEDYARSQAVRDALKQAMLDAGASVSSIQQLSNGVVTRDQFQIRANSEVRQYQVTHEEIRSSRMFVRLRAYIVADATGCPGGIYPKNMTLIRFSWLDRNQATYGQIYRLDQVLSKSLFDRLSQQRQVFVAQRWIDHVLGIEPARLEQGAPQDIYQLQQIANQTNSQFLIFGQIMDASLAEENDHDSNFIPKDWYRNPIRKFALQLFIYDGITGQLLERPVYQTQAEWTFSRNSIIDPNSQAFWQSSYGMEISATLQNITQELRQRMQCERPVARITWINSQDYHINLGRKNGLKIGDRLRILHKADYADSYGQPHPARNAALGSMEVREVYPENAIMTPASQYAAGNIQINDIAVLE